jgi:putative ABC transport system permease protein
MRVINGFRALFRKTRAEEELDTELRAFLETAVEQKMRAGMSREEATRAARIELGSAEAVKDWVRDVGWESMVESFYQDLRYAVRMLHRAPGFTAAAVLTLALGIGATTAIFSFVNAVMLRPLPFKESARLALVQPDARASGPFPIRTVTPADFLEWELQNRVFEEMAGFSGATFNITGAGEPERLYAATVTTRFFESLSVNPAVGRTFLTSEGQPGANQVVLISSALWRRRFQSDPGIVGREITLDGKTFAVVGVMPDGFSFPRDLLPGMGRSRRVDLWAPLVLRPGDRANAFLQVVARLRADVTIEQAQAEMNAIVARLAEQVPPERRGNGVRLVALHEHMTQEVRSLLLVFLGAVGFLLLIACSNVANLLVARGAARQKEVAVRAALGAGRWRLVRQFLTESVVLGLLGGLAGLLLAVQGVNVVTALIPPGSLPRLEETGIDRQALAFTVLISCLTGLVFGLVPALRASATDISSTIKELGAAQTPRSRFLNLLVVCEVALAFVLLAGAGLMFNSFWRLTRVNPGFAPERILTVSVTLPEGAYETSAEMRVFSTGVLERLRGAPGLVRAAAINWLPFGGAGITGNFTVEGIPRLPQGGSFALKPAVSPEYFHVMGIPLVRGRAFDERDGEQAAGVAIVSDRLARVLWPGADPIGKRLKLGFGRPEEQPWLSVVGVVGDVKQTALADETPPVVYVPLLQAPRPFLLRDLTFVVQTAAEPSSVAPVVRAEIRNVDPNLPFARVETMRDLLSDSVAEPRFRSAMLGAFAGAALALVATGILGVLAYSVTRRTREIGVRMALGAQRAGVLRLVVGQALRMTMAGLAVGLVAAFALTRLLRNFLFDVGPLDPATFVAASIVLVGAALIASYVPARRAATVDPLTALRAE